MIGNLTKGGDTLEQPPIYVAQLKQIAKKMEVFPIDLIARQGPLTSPYKMIYHEELTRDEFRTFYDFCELALSATEKDIETCLGKLETFSPKEQALLLTIIYVYSFPWSDKFPSALFRRDNQKQVLSWLSLNYTNFNTENRRSCSVHTRTKYQSLIKRFVDNDKIAFSEVILNFDKKNNHEKERTALRNEMKEKVSEEKMREYGLDIISRKEYFLYLEKKYPQEYQQKISDILFVFYPEDYFPSLIASGVGPKSGNASATPKTVGQIAQQLLSSLESTNE
jgi:hypothetical protein